MIITLSMKKPFLFYFTSLKIFKIKFGKAITLWNIKGKKDIKTFIQRSMINLGMMEKKIYHGNSALMSERFTMNC